MFKTEEKFETFEFVILILFRNLDFVLPIYFPG